MQSIIELQWGHDLLIVEGWVRETWSPIPDTLQWGHDLLIVEGADVCGQREILHELQWGHDLLIVEGAIKDLRVQAEARSFNGATIC